MRVLVVVAVGLWGAVASADPSYRVLEDAALGIDLQPDHPLLGDLAGIDACANGATAPTGSAVFWLEISKAGKVSAAYVHGAGKLDACLEKALAKAVVAVHAPIILAGHIDLMERTSSKFLASPRMSSTPVVLDAHHTKWQLTATKLAYTANRMLDITAALDGVSLAVADCADRRGESATAARALVWMDGHPIVRSGTIGYDDCVAKALAPVKLPAPESAFWMQLEITPPTEALAPRTDKAALSHPQAIRDGVTTAVRSRKLDLQQCLDGHKGAVLTTLSVTLHGNKANVKSVATGNPDADACVRKKFHDIVISSATAADKADLDVVLDPE